MTPTDAPVGFHLDGWYRYLSGDDANWHPIWKADPPPVKLALQNPDGTWVGDSA